MDGLHHNFKLKYGKYQFQVSLIVVLTSFILPVVILIMPMMQRRPDFFYITTNGQKILVDKDQFCNKIYYSMSFDEIYDKIEIDYTKIDNWAADLKFVCNTKNIFSLATSVYFIGSAASNYGLSKVPDNYGRRKIFIILNIVTSIALFQLCFLYHYAQIIISSFILGLASLNLSIGSIILNETLDPSTSGLVMGIANAMFPLSGIINTLIIYFFSSWKIFYFFVCLVSLLACYLSIYYLKESPKWLLDNGKITSYIITMKYIILLNGHENEHKEMEFIFKNEYGQISDSERDGYTECPSSDSEDENKQKFSSNFNTLKTMNFTYENKSSYEIIDIFTYNSLRTISIITFYLWVLTGFSFFGLLLNLENLTGNIFVDSLVSYSGELLAEIISGYLANIYGKDVVYYSLVLTTVSSIGFSFINNFYVRIPLLFLSSIGISSGFNVLYIFTPQYYPTNVRALALSFFSLSNRIAAGFVPTFLNFFDNLILIIGILSGIGSILLRLLPDVLDYKSGSDIAEKKIVRKFSKSIKNI